jgi:hypothetical protein
MKGKILFLAGLGVGYVLGTRAGRERYEEIKAAAKNLWNAPVVQKQVDNVQDFVKDKAPDVVEFVADGAKKVAAQVSGRTTTARTPAKKATTSTAAKKAPAAKKPTSTAKKPASSSGS